MPRIENWKKIGKREWKNEVSEGITSPPKRKFDSLKEFKKVAVKWMKNQKEFNRRQ